MTRARAMVLVVGPVLAACVHQTKAIDQSAAAVGTSAVLDANTAATEVAVARCRHEAECDNVGPGRRYASSGACVAELTQSAATDLAPRTCPSGIDSGRLTRCAVQFQRESCEPLAPLTRMYACDPPVLCHHLPSVTVSPEDVYGVGGT
jgi:hypothetical protein